MKRFILVGADPLGGHVAHPGGQLTACEGLIRYADENGLTLEVIDTAQSSFPVPSIGQRLKKGIARVIELRKKLRTKEFNGVIIFSSSGLSFYERALMAILCRRRKVPSIFFVRSGHFINELNGSNFKRRIASKILQYTDVIGAQGQPWVDFYDELGVSLERVCVVRNWLSFDFIASERPKTVFPQKTLRFVFVGWLVEAKGVRQLLQAAEKLAAEYAFELVFIGNGTLADEISMQASRIQNIHIETLGWIDRQRLQNELRRSDVFVLPSEAEGFPNALLEAMASGLPVICTDVGAVSDSVHDGVNGFLLADNGPGAIYEAMREYLDDPMLIEKHSAGSLAVFRKQHGWEENCKHLFSQLETR